MRFYRYIAALAGFSLLCGCANNTTSSAPEVTSTETSAPTAEVPQENTSDQSAPVEAPAVTAGGGNSDAVPETTAADPGGIDLVSEKYSENSLIFDLNGTYCDVSELPFSVETFKPELSEEYVDLLNVRDGKLIYQVWRDEGSEWYATSEWSVFTYDLRTEEVTEVFNSQDALADREIATVMYANEEYVVIHVCYDSQNTYRVYRYGETEPVFTLPESDEDNHYFVNWSMYIVYDQFFFDGECRFAGFDKTVPVIYRAYLTHNDFDVYAANVTYPRYGVCNVCFNLAFQDITGVIDSSYLSNLRGDFFRAYDGNTNTILENTYYPVQITNIPDEILGCRCDISWLDRNSNSYKIGTTGFGYYAETAHITTDGIFTMPLYRQNTGTIKKLLVGMYDKYSGKNIAALITCDNRNVYAENTALYYVDRQTLEAIMISPHEEVNLYANGDNN